MSFRLMKQYFEYNFEQFRQQQAVNFQKNKLIPRENYWFIMFTYQGMCTVYSMNAITHA